MPPSTIYGDVQGRGCKIWYHGDCVHVSKSRGKCMEHVALILFVQFV